MEVRDDDLSQPMLERADDLEGSETETAAPAEVKSSGGNSRWMLGLSRRCAAVGCSYRMRRVKAKGAILVLVLNALVDVSYYGALTRAFQLFLKYFDTHPAGLVIFLEQVLTNSLPFILLYPVAGWLADTRFGRFKVIRASLWMLWCGFLALFVAFLLSHFIITNHKFYEFTLFGAFPVIFVLINVGLAGFQANIIPFGLDQMPTGSAEEMSAFIHWYYFTRNIGVGIVLTILICTSSELFVVVQSAVEAVFLSSALLIIYCLKKWFVMEPQSRENPFKMVYDVIKFAWEHKSPVNRSSLTYWEDKLPSRIDLGKMKYGGPFNTETVEAVKAFLQISGLLAALGGFVIAFTVNVSLFFGHLKDIRIPNLNCTVGQVLLSELNPLPILVFLLIYEFLIYPFLRNYIPSTLYRMGAGFIVIIFTAFPPLVVDAYGHSATNGTAETYACYLVNVTAAAKLNIQAYFLTIPYLVAAIAEMLAYIGALEFISAQSPYNMHGLLIGVYYCVRGVFSLVSNAITLIFSLAFTSNPYFGPPSCGSIYFSVMIALAVAGLIVYVPVAARYQRRQRNDDDELLNQHMFVENYYAHASSSLQNQ